MTLLELTDYINSRQPIVTAAGVLFSRHGDKPNPLIKVIQKFLDLRKEYKDKMFSYPKGSEEYEHYNLMQSLAKIDTNGIYGSLGMYSCLLYNVNIATSITAQGRALVATAQMFFESFLANNVKFGSLNELMTFINNVKKERVRRKYKDYDLLDRDITPDECFTKVVMSSGFRWVPDEDEMEIIWTSINNLNQEDLNRVYYKNNLYEFMSNKSMIESIRYIIRKLDKPYLNPLKCPKEIQAEIDTLSEILQEYVYYGYMVIDRIDRADNMIKSVCLISDTDSAIISLDGWYRFCLQYLQDEQFNILRYTVDPLYELESDEFGDITDSRWKKAISFVDTDYDYDFFNDEVIEMKHTIEPLKILPEDNLRYSIINIMAYVMDKLVNDYLEIFSKEQHSYRGPKKCKLILKNEFLFRRALLTNVKKSYATIQEIQEGNFIEQKMDTALDIKGIACMAKASMSDYTRKELKKITYEDILNTPVIDQLKVVKDIAILEKRVMQSLFDGSKDFYKPLAVKSMDHYEDPMRQQGIKASIVWNTLRDDNMIMLDLREKNSVSVAKVNINDTTVEKIKDKYPELYLRCKELLSNKYFLGGADCIAIPYDQDVPEWLSEFIDYNTIVNDNIGGYPLDSIGICRMENNNVNYTNILKL